MLQRIIQRVHEVMMQHLQAAVSNPAMATSSQLTPTCATLKILQTLDKTAPDYVTKFTGPLVKLFHCIEREHTAHGTALASGSLPGWALHSGSVCHMQCIQSVAIWA